MKFAHIADVHLGYRQYGLEERYNDFSKAWLETCQLIAEIGCDFTLLAGDLFHSKDIDPLTLAIAQQGLRTMGCPVYAIKGNHDMPKIRADSDWIEYLANTGFLIEIDTVKFGYLLVGDSTIVHGLPWSGYDTNSIIKNAITPIAGMFNILMVHAGYDQPYGVNLDYDLVKGFDYVALGHIHYPMHYENLHQPGSLETVNAVEAMHPKRGLLVYDNGIIQKINTPRRPFFRLDKMPENPDPEAIYDIKSAGTGGFHTIVRKDSLVKPPSPRTSITEAIRQLTDHQPEAVIKVKEYVLESKFEEARQVIENEI